MITQLSFLQQIPHYFYSALYHGVILATSAIIALIGVLAKLPRGFILGSICTAVFGLMGALAFALAWAIATSALTVIAAKAVHTPVDGQAMEVAR